MDDGLLTRIERAVGVPGLVDVLAERLPPADLRSLLLAVHRRHAARLTPAKVLERYEQSRFTGPSTLDPRMLATFHHRSFALLTSLGYAGVELSPVSPLGTVSVVAPIDQNNVLTTSRGSEVVADATNSLALECAARRRARLRADPRDREWIRLYASHRLLRGQPYDNPTMRPHFQLLGLTTAGRAEGSFRFETRSLVEHIDALLRLLTQVREDCVPLDRTRVTLTDLTGGTRTPALRELTMAPLRERHPGVEFAFDDERTKGRGYYVDTCFHIHAAAPSGAVVEIADGGFTTWTRDLLSNAKERLLIAGLGVELLLNQFAYLHDSSGKDRLNR